MLDPRLGVIMHPSRIDVPREFQSSHFSPLPRLAIVKLAKVLG